MMTKKKIKFLHEGKYAAEVEVEVIITDNEWSPYLPIEEAYKLDDVRDALKRGDLQTAMKMARVYELHAVAA